MKKIVTGFATLSIFLAAFTPVLAATTTVTISGNGEESVNSVLVKNKCKTVVKQSNTIDSTVNLTVNGNTGGNEVSHNTGSGNTINTGSVTNSVTVDLTGGDNTINSVPTCCCAGGEGSNSQTVSVTNNGEETVNTVTIKNKHKLILKQKSKLKSSVTASVTGDTGNNESEHNTGGSNSTTTSSVGNTVGGTLTGGANIL